MPPGSDESDLLLQILRDAKPVKRELTPHLEPEDSPYSPVRFELGSYDLVVFTSLLVTAEREAESLAPRWQREEMAGLVCKPSFAPEWALRVEGDRKLGFWVILTEAEKNLWYSTRGESEMLSPVSVKRSSNELDKTVGTAVCNVWSKVLSQTRYSENPFLGCDGVTYHFAYSKRGIPATAGKTWSPAETTIPGKLVALACSLKDYARDPDNQDAFLQAVNDQLAWLEAHLS
jgi:hypothetical protein